MRIYSKTGDCTGVLSRVNVEYGGMTLPEQPTVEQLLALVTELQQRIGEREISAQTGRARPAAREADAPQAVLAKRLLHFEPELFPFVEHPTGSA